MTSSQNSDPLSPKTATLMVALDKITLQMNQMQQHHQQQFERLQKSNEDVNMRLEGVERRRRHDDSGHYSHNDEEEHVFRPRRGQRREAFGNHMLMRDNDE